MIRSTEDLIYNKFVRLFIQCSALMAKKLPCDQLGLLHCLLLNSGKWSEELSVFKAKQ